MGGIAQHTETLFCWMSSKQRQELDLQLGKDVDRQLWETGAHKDHWCFVIVYGSFGIETAEKKFGEPRAYAAPGRCATTRKTFKGCVHRWSAAYSKEVLQENYLQEFPIVQESSGSGDDGNTGASLLCALQHQFLSCNGRRWYHENGEAKYRAGVYREARNCNGFAQTLLRVLDLNESLNLDTMLSNTHFKPIQTCDFDEPRNKQLADPATGTKCAVWRRNNPPMKPCADRNETSIKDECLGGLQVESTNGYDNIFKVKCLCNDESGKCRCIAGCDPSDKKCGTHSPGKCNLACCLRTEDSKETSESAAYNVLRADLDWFDASPPDDSATCSRWGMTLDPGREYRNGKCKRKS